MMGSFSLLQFVRMESKYVLHADSTTRCAFSVCPSHANVTSQKQPRSRSCENIVCKLLWWYFHLKQYCCGNMVGLKVEAVIKRRWKKREMKTGGEGIMTNNYEILFSVHAWRKALWQIKGPGVLVQQLGRLKFMLFFPSNNSFFPSLLSDKFFQVFEFLQLRGIMQKFCSLMKRFQWKDSVETVGS